ncbi:flagellar biosynthetic protein FliR [Planctomycetota bacterium]
MNLQSISHFDPHVMALLQAGGLTFVRVAVFVFCVPPFLGKPVPIRFRLGFAALLAFIAASIQTQPTPIAAGNLPILLFQEIIVGFALGFATSSVLTAFQMAGTLIERLSGGSLLSSSGRSENGSPLTAFYYGAATTLFFLSGVHRIVVDGLLSSFSTLPTGVEWTMPSAASFLAQLLGMSFEFALRVASPVALTLMAASIVTAVVARFVRTFSFFGIGMNLNACLLVAALLVSCVLLPSLFEQQFEAAFEIATKFLQSIRV